MTSQTNKWPRTGGKFQYRSPIFRKSRIELDSPHLRTGFKVVIGGGDFPIKDISRFGFSLIDESKKFDWKVGAFVDFKLMGPNQFELTGEALIRHVTQGAPGQVVGFQTQFSLALAEVSVLKTIHLASEKISDGLRSLDKLPPSLKEKISYLERFLGHTYLQVREVEKSMLGSRSFEKEKFEGTLIREVANAVVTELDELELILDEMGFVKEGKDNETKDEALLVSDTLKNLIAPHFHTGDSALVHRINSLVRYKRSNSNHLPEDNQNESFDSLYLKRILDEIEGLWERTMPDTTSQLDRGGQRNLFIQSGGHFDEVLEVIRSTPVKNLGQLRFILASTFEESLSAIQKELELLEVELESNLNFELLEISEPQVEFADIFSNSLGEFEAVIIKDLVRTQELTLTPDLFQILTQSLNPSGILSWGLCNPISTRGIVNQSFFNSGRQSLTVHPREGGGSQPSQLADQSNWSLDWSSDRAVGWVKCIPKMIAE